MNCVNGTVEIIVSVGSNCGDRHRNVAEGIEWLQSRMEGSRFSSIYATPDFHGGARQYMNAVGIGRIQKTLKDFDAECKKHEMERGRTPEARLAGDVPLDIDIVVYDGGIIREADYRRQFFKIGFEQLR